MKKALISSIIINILFLFFLLTLIMPQNKIQLIKSWITNSRLPSDKFTEYYYTLKSIYEVMPNDSNEIIFLGNSITNNCNWGELLQNPKIKNRGIGGDVIKGVMMRLDEIVESKPSKIFLMIGINDLNQGNKVDSIIISYEKLIKLIIDLTPDTKLFIQSLLPVYKYPAQRNMDIIKINEKLKLLCHDYNTTYIDLYNLYVTESNKLDSIYSYDGLHLNGRGYLLWKRKLKEYLN